jgi:hypothetical protein
VVQRTVNKPDKSRAIRGLSSGGDEHSFGKMTPYQLLNREVLGDGLQRPLILRHPALPKRLKILISIQGVIPRENFSTCMSLQHF